MNNLIKYISIVAIFLISFQIKANDCQRLFSQGAIEQAEKACTQISQLAEKDSDEYFWSQFILFDIAHYLGKQEQAYEQLLKISEHSLNTDIQYELLRRQGHYYRLKKRFQYAQSYYLEALAIAEKQQNQNKLAKSYNDVGLIYLKEYKYQQSLEYFTKSLDIKKQLNNKVLIRSTLTNIGLLSYKTGDYQTALGYYQEAEEILNQLEQTQNNSAVVENQRVHLYSYLAAIYEKLNDYNQRDAYLMQLEDGIAKIKNDKEVQNRYLNLVEILIDMDSFYVAKRAIEKVNLELKNPHDNNAQLYYQLSYLEYQLGNLEIAKIYAEKSLNEMQKYQTQDYQEKIYNLFYQIEKGLNNFASALEWFEKYNSSRLNDLEKQTSQDFRMLRYEQNIKNSRNNLMEEKLKTALLEKKKTRYYLGFLATFAGSIIIILFLYYQRKIMIKNNRILNQDIEKHKEICKNLEKPPVNFKYLFRNKSFAYLIMDESNHIIASNFLKNDEQKSAVLEQMLRSSMEPLIESGMLLTKTELIPKAVKDILCLEESDFFNVQKVISDEYSIVFFFKENEILDIDLELNALTQFNFYLSNHSIKDISYTRKLVVDCMKFCLKVWKKRTMQSKIEFAYQSKIWKINVDDGRLRTRSLDKYFSINAIPKNPRIHQVVKSCHFMLTLKQLNHDERIKIKFYIEKLQQV